MCERGRSAALIQFLKLRPNSHECNIGAFCAQIRTTSPGITARLVTLSVRVTGPAVELELVTAIGA